jgi:hypothetical protein
VALACVRLVHSAIFAVILGCIGWLLATGLVGRRDRTVLAAASIVTAEATVWLANDRVCPLTPLAERLGARRGTVSDIFLPAAMARTLPAWSSALLVLAAALHLRAAGHAGRTPLTPSRVPAS